MGNQETLFEEGVWIRFYIDSHSVWWYICQFMWSPFSL